MEWWKFPTCQICWNHHLEKGGSSSTEEVIFFNNEIKTPRFKDIFWFLMGSQFELLPCDFKILGWRNASDLMIVASATGYTTGPATTSTYRFPVQKLGHSHHWKYGSVRWYKAPPSVVFFERFSNLKIWILHMFGILKRGGVQVEGESWSSFPVVFLKFCKDASDCVKTNLRIASYPVPLACNICMEKIALVSTYLNLPSSQRASHH